jgi:cbb3-type cytochrome oxidase subunit 3
MENNDLNEYEVVEDEEASGVAMSEPEGEELFGDDMHRSARGSVATTHNIIVETATSIATIASLFLCAVVTLHVKRKTHTHSQAARAGMPFDH